MQSVLNAPKYVLLADDDSDDCMLFEDALRQIDASTTLKTASDGDQLMTFLSHKVPPQPDIIFLDLNMPRKNGLECLEQIRQSSILNNIPVVIFSTSIMNDTVTSSYYLGANLYIQKPASFIKLIATIKEVLSIDWTFNKRQPSLGNFLVQY